MTRTHHTNYNASGFQLGGATPWRDWQPGDPHPFHGAYGFLIERRVEILHLADEQGVTFAAETYGLRPSVIYMWRRRWRAFAQGLLDVPAEAPPAKLRRVAHARHA